MQTSYDPIIQETEMYQRAIEADPRNSRALGNYAVLLTDVFQDHDAAQAMYQRAIEADPKNFLALDGYANFLSSVRKDHDAAQVLYQRAIKAGPNNSNTLGNYAVFLADVRKDEDAARDMFVRAIEADLTNSNALGNYARLLLTTGRMDEGIAMLIKAFAELNSDENPVLNAECWMYAYCCRAITEQRAALTELKALITQGVRTGEWDLSGVIKQALKMAHPHSQWLPKLAEVLAGRADADTLADWVAWQSA
jgi:Tfp pilus assembly protein PilF